MQVAWSPPLPPFPLKVRETLRAEWLFGFCVCCRTTASTESLHQLSRQLNGLLAEVRFFFFVLTEVRYPCPLFFFLIAVIHHADCMKRFVFVPKWWILESYHYLSVQRFVVVVENFRVWFGCSLHNLQHATTWSPQTCILNMIIVLIFKLLCLLVLLPHPLLKLFLFSTQFATPHDMLHMRTKYVHKSTVLWWKKRRSSRKLWIGSNVPTVLKIWRKFWNF